MCRWINGGVALRTLVGGSAADLWWEVKQRINWQIYRSENTLSRAVFSRPLRRTGRKEGTGIFRRERDLKEGCRREGCREIGETPGVLSAKQTRCFVGVLGETCDKTNPHNKSTPKPSLTFTNSTSVCLWILGNPYVCHFAYDIALEKVA